jgi:hypothetical protein
MTSLTAQVKVMQALANDSTLLLVIGTPAGGAVADLAALRVRLGVVAGLLVGALGAERVDTAASTMLPTAAWLLPRFAVSDRARSLDGDVLESRPEPRRLARRTR